MHVQLLHAMCLSHQASSRIRALQQLPAVMRLQVCCEKSLVKLDNLHVLCISQGNLACIISPDAAATPPSQRTLHNCMLCTPSEPSPCCGRVQAASRQVMGKGKAVWWPCKQGRVCPRCPALDLCPAASVSSPCSPRGPGMETRACPCSPSPLR